MVYDDDDDTIEEPAYLRRLRFLVTVLTLVLIGGIVVLVAVIVIRLGGISHTPQPVTAKRIVLPAGGEIVSTGQGDGTVLFVLRDPDGVEHLHIYDASTGVGISTTQVDRAEE